jgi:hypothetical protein
MKRSVLDITKKLYRSNNRIRLNAHDLGDINYYIFKKIGYTFPNVFYEMINNIDPKDSVRLTINNVYISNDDFILESDTNSITVKLIKNRISYLIDQEDVLILQGSIQYAE